VNIIIRPATTDDADDIAAIYAPYVVSSAVSFEESAPEPREIAKRIRAAAPLYPWLVAVSDDIVLGYAYAAPFRERTAYRFTVETSVYVAADMQRLGIGRALYHALIRTLTTQGFTQAIAAIALPNENSIDLHEAVGFQRAGVYRGVGWKHGAWRDIGLWQRALAIAEDPPEEPRAFADVGVVQG
jgi:L-amino acid N-acyltransferase YncA